jgi:hypothetical protein
MLTISNISPIQLIRLTNSVMKKSRLNFKGFIKSILLRKPQEKKKLINEEKMNLEHPHLKMMILEDQSQIPTLKKGNRTYKKRKSLERAKTTFSKR